MNTTDDLKKFSDPLLGGVSQPRMKREQTHTHSEERSNDRNWKPLYISAVVLALGFLAFYLYQAQQQISVLSDELTLNKGQMDVMAGNLENSKVEIEGLSEGLESSKNQLASQKNQITRYKGLYSGLKDGQTQQTRELEAIGLEKADRTEVNVLKNETAQLEAKVASTDSDVAQVREQANQNRSRLEETQTLVSTVQESVTLNTNEISDVKRSLEREYYNFELQEKGGYMKVFDVSMSLKDTDWRKRQFDMYLLAGGKVIQKKDHSINEPIFFYVEGQKKPYEVVVTRVDKKLVVGYLSVPRG